MSMWASGSVGSALSFGMRRGKAVCMKHPRHVIRNTEAQRQVRAAVWYAHDMWRRIGETNRDLWRSYFDPGGRNGFEAWSHVLQNRYWGKARAWVKCDGEPAFPFEGVHQWLVFDNATVFGYISLGDVAVGWSPSTGDFEEKFEHQYECFKGDGATKYVMNTPSSAPDYGDGLFVCADVVSVDANEWRTIVCHSESNDYVGHWLLAQTNGGQFRIRADVGGSGYYGDGGQNRVGYAQRVGGLWNLSKMWLYVDGTAFEGLATFGTLSTGTEPLYIGCFYRPDQGRIQYHNGWIDNVVFGSGVGTSVFEGRP